jgi:hypothetical protein
MMESNSIAMLLVEVVLISIYSFAHSPGMASQHFDFHATTIIRPP